MSILPLLTDESTGTKFFKGAFNSIITLSQNFGQLCALDSFW